MAELSNARPFLLPPKRSGALSPFHEAKRGRPRFAKWGLAHFCALEADSVPDRFRDMVFRRPEADGGGPGVSPGSPLGAAAKRRG